MAIQQINLGSMPLGAGGDSQRAANTKINENFSNTTHAASRLVGKNKGNVPEIENNGFAGTGWGSRTAGELTIEEFRNPAMSKVAGVYSLRQPNLPSDDADRTVRYSYVVQLPYSGVSQAQIVISQFNPTVQFRVKRDGFSDYDVQNIYTDKNTTKDGNGFIKASSPVVDLYDDKIELNDDAQKQGIEFTKNSKGDYTLKTKTGLRSDDTWQIEIPQDNNKNPLFAVDIDTQDDGTVNIKCYKRIFSMETFLFGPDFNEPMDITEGRFISVRLNDNPEEQPDEPIE